MFIWNCDIDMSLAGRNWTLRHGLEESEEQSSWASPAQSLLCSGPVGTHNHNLFIPRPLICFEMGPPDLREEGSLYYLQEPVLVVKVSVFKRRTTNRKSVCVWLRFSVSSLRPKAESLSKTHVELHVFYASLPMLSSNFFPNVSL